MNRFASSKCLHSPPTQGGAHPRLRRLDHGARWIIVFVLLLWTPAAWAQCGNCDGQGAVSVLDALAAARHAVGLDVIQGPRILDCDFNGDGAVTVLDSLLIAQVAAGLSPMPNCLQCGNCDLTGGVDILDCAAILDHRTMAAPLTQSAFAACDTEGDLDVDLTDSNNLDCTSAMPSPAPQPCISCGDCNMDGVVDFDDVTRAQMNPPTSGRGFDACNINGSGGIEPQDVFAITELVFGRVVTLTCPDAASSVRGLMETPGGYCVEGRSSGVSWAFDVVIPGMMGSFPGVVPPQRAGATEVEMVAAWVTALNAVLPPGIDAAPVAPPSDNCFIFTGATGVMVTITSSGSLCTPMAGMACPFNPLLVGVKDVDGNKPAMAQDDRVWSAGVYPTTLDVLDNDFDIDGVLDSSSLSVTIAPTQGVAKVSEQTLTYVPYADAVGEDTLTYEVCDDQGACDSAVVRILLGPEDPLVAQDDVYVVKEGVLLKVFADEGLLTNDSGEADQKLLLVDLDGESAFGGTVTPLDLDGAFTYAPREGFAGIDTFDYTVCDMRHSCDTATAVVEVMGRDKGREN